METYSVTFTVTYITQAPDPWLAEQCVYDAITGSPEFAHILDTAAVDERSVHVAQFDPTWAGGVPDA
jgi:hypothetical protein